MAYLYVCSHICAVPITFCIVALNPHRFGLRRAEDLDDDELEMMGDAAFTERIREQRREQAQRAMSNLTMGNFQSVAGQIVKEDEDASCVICQEYFTERDDDVIELECDERHIFHTQCLRPWLEK